jgi:hypothetical protein
MSIDKAHDLFSSYFDGTLDSSLRRALEAKFQSEPSLRQEYDEFASLFKELDDFRHEEIEIPIYLSDRIATRLEEAQAKQPALLNPFGRWARGLGFAALASVAIVGAYTGITASSNHAVGPVIVESANEIDYSVANGRVSVDFQPISNRALIITTDGARRRILPTGGRTTSPLINQNPGPSVFRVQLEGDSHSTVIIAPGTQRNLTATGTGTVIDYAKALSAFFLQPVRIDTNQVGDKFSWTISGTDLLSASQSTLSDHGYTSDVRKGGLICILDR